MRLAGWAHSVIGQYVTAPGGLGGQCVDLVNVYIAQYGLAPVRANAVDWAKPRAVSAPGWRFAMNMPHNYPAPGDVIVWGPTPLLSIGPDGHIAVVMVADVMSVLSLDQNWGPGVPATLVFHSYTGVLGWWHKM